MATGTLKWFSEEKRHGFIVPDDGVTDLFVHRSALRPGQRSLREGARVRFELCQGRKGTEAANVVELEQARCRAGAQSLPRGKPLTALREWGLFAAEPNFRLWVPKIRFRREIAHGEGGQARAHRLPASRC
jgi:CspA family cold shock protein